MLSSIVPPECTQYHEYTLIPWSMLVDLQHLSDLCPIIERWDTSSAWLRRYLNVSTVETAHIKDLHPYHFQLFDNAHDSHPLKPKYYQRINIPDMASELESYRLIHFGTLFGTTRLRLTSPDGIRFRRQVRERMVFQNPALLRIARSISSLVGGDETGAGYVGIHLRLGDSFAIDGYRNSRSMWWTLLHKGFHLDMSEIARIESDTLGPNGAHDLTPPNLHIDETAHRYPHPPLSDVRYLNQSNHRNCLGTLHSRLEHSALNTPIFIATDVKKPRVHLALELFRKTLPCVFFLSDFDNVLSPLKTSDIFFNDDEGLRVDTFLLPFVDAMVASMGREVLGTPHSTFSRFTVDVLHRAYHGWPIVERG
ncbi:uncharacterized protein EI90DRAFT_3054329 [Cantharellus anzutake]|uniref:uncharacterized protein n=1 Tax=Cantharellus anzutake TaxID=1750568 RepID=UPI001903942C|nr:uncharacterized protein EI90DRAFT_3054329 [Cantharellus anzutake]KAF8332767.1 hypothetical protein EI90DRAFT_3054329 [Cantharellus anzutake]